MQIMQYWKNGKWVATPGEEQARNILIKKMQIAFSRFKDEYALEILKYGFLKD